MKFSTKIFGLISLAFLFVSCAGVKNITYFRDSNAETAIELPQVQTIKIGVADKLSIVVSSKDPALAAIFNLPIVAFNASSFSNGASSHSGNNVSTYTVDSNGNIDFPIIGTVHVGGLSREEIADLIKNEIRSRDLIKDAVVTVEFANLYVSVLGEVRNPGRHSLDRDRVTILDAIAKAGDLNVTGLRTNVKVFREENGVQKCYAVDLTSADSVFKSPVYYLLQDDVIYVEPNKLKARTSTVNGNNILSIPFWVSAGSFIVSVTTMILTATKK